MLHVGSKSLHPLVQRLLMPSVRQQVAKPQVLTRSQQNCSKQERRYWTECTEYEWRSGKLVSGRRNGRSPCSSHFPRSVMNTNTRSYQSSISIILHPRPLIPNHSLFSSMTSVLFFRLLQPLPMNLSSPVTSTFILIILQTLSPLSFCLFSLLSVSVNMFNSLRTTKITFSI